MRNDCVFDNELFDEEFNEEFDEQDSCLEDIDYCLTESDFYPPSDNRVWKSRIKDIDGGDNFADYCIEFFEMLDEEEYYDS